VQFRPGLLIANLLLTPIGVSARTPDQPPYQACKPGDFTVIGYPDELWPKHDGRFRVLDHMLRPVLGVRGGNTILRLRAPLSVQRFLRQVLAARSVATRAGSPPRD
jgi:hypothetical protein